MSEIDSCSITSAEETVSLKSDVQSPQGRKRFRGLLKHRPTTSSSASHKPAPGLAETIEAQVSKLNAVCLLGNPPAYEVNTGSTSDGGVRYDYGTYADDWLDLVRRTLEDPKMAAALCRVSVQVEGATYHLQRQKQRLGEHQRVFMVGELGALQLKLDTYRSEQEQTLEVISGLKKEVQGLRERVGAQLAELGCVRDEYEKAQVVIKEQTAKGEEIAVELKQVQSDKLFAVQDAKDLEFEVEGLKTELRGLKKQVADFETERTTSQSEHKILVDNLAGRDFEIERLSFELEQTTFQLSQAKAQAKADSTVEADLSRLKDELSSAQSALSAETAKAEHVQQFYESFVERTSETKQTLERTNEDLRQQLEKAESLVHSHEATINRLTQEVESTKSADRGGAGCDSIYCTIKQLQTCNHNATYEGCAQAGIPDKEEEKSTKLKVKELEDLVSQLQGTNAKLVEKLAEVEASQWQQKPSKARFKTIRYH